ncbi:MAG: DNA replication/repair protein RecF [Clostridiales Family XIII bacterium]|jgi:DNA replication and repair protein RecF|nr:DNA replication/repair protein RecF [Clostridiales Family XIII bacterium]
MKIEKILLRNFRNYKEEEVSFDERLNVVTGENGQGKTNLIEAVGFLSMAKSFRTRREQEMVRSGEEALSVKGHFEKRGSPFTVEIVWRGAGGQREFFVNGAEKGSVFDLLGGAYTIVFSPEDLSIVKGGPDARRRFLDREIILLRPVYYHKLKKYKGVLKNRNALLKKEGADPGLLDVYDEQLAAAGAAVMAERAAYAEALSRAAAESVSMISDGREALSAAYRPSALGGERDPSGVTAGEYEEAMRGALRRGRERDLFLGATEAGPHRDDLALSLNGSDLRVYGSQGQQRTAALALRLAERALIKQETGEDAILLLDDVMSELDAGRQGRILSAFSGNQVFVTAAEAPAALGGARVIRVRGGFVEKNTF